MGVVIGPRFVEVVKAGVDTVTMMAAKQNICPLDGADNNEFERMRDSTAILIER